jgi:DNA polymerase III subunit delta
MRYVFHGKDELGRSEALAELRAELPADLADLNTANLDGRRLKLEQLAAACEAQPFLAERRLVVVTDALKHSKAGKEREELRAYLEQVPDWCDLVFYETEDVDKRNQVFTYLSKAGSVREFPQRQADELPGWLITRAKPLNVTLLRDAAQRLVEYVGVDARRLWNELQKLAAYVGNRGTINVAAVERLVVDDQEQNLFAFIDDLSSRRLAAALRGARALIADGQAPPYILFMVARQLRVLIGMQDCVARRLDDRATAAALGIQPFLIKKTAAQLRNFSGNELIAAHDRLLELDHWIKTGRIQPETALEVFVGEICSRPSNSRT